MTVAGVLDTAAANIVQAGIGKDEVERFIRRNRLQLEGRIRSQLSPLGRDRIVLFCMGLGRDSFTMLCLLLEGKLIAQQTLVQPQDLAAVVFADTGYEWQQTYQTLPLARELCARANLRFLHLEKPQKEGEAGWQAWTEGWSERRASGHARALPPWRQDPPASIEARARSGYYHGRAPILDDYQMRSSVISIAKQDCTSNHKIAAIRRVLEDLASERFDSSSNADWGREVRKGARPPHLMLIGYAADEHHRLSHGDCSPDYVEEAYPLVEAGIRKADETLILERWQLNHVHKSGCYICPYQPVSWYWALREVDPQAWASVLQYEQTALARNPRMTVLPGRGTLEHEVNAWRERNPDATVDAVLSKAYTRCRTAHREEQPTTVSMESLSEPCPLPDGLLSWVMARVKAARGAGPLPPALREGSA